MSPGKELTGRVGGLQAPWAADGLRMGFATPLDQIFVKWPALGLLTVCLQTWHLVVLGTYLQVLQCDKSQMLTFRHYLICMAPDSSDVVELGTACRYYIVDQPLLRPNKPMVLLNIPDGRQQKS